MAGLADELLKMAKLKRTRTNFDTVSETIADLVEHASNAADLLTALSTLKEALNDFEGALDETGDDNVLTDAWTVDARDAVAAFRKALPGDDADDDLGEMISELDSTRDEYESAQDDPDHNRESRDEIWGQMMDQLEGIAGVIS